MDLSYKNAEILHVRAVHTDPRAQSKLQKSLKDSARESSLHMR